MKKGKAKEAKEVPRNIPPQRLLLAEWIKEEREAAGFTQASAAHRLGTTVTSVSRWETGRHPIGGEDLIAMVVLYDAIDAYRKFLLAHGEKFAHTGWVPVPDRRAARVRQHG